MRFVALTAMPFYRIETQLCVHVAREEKSGAKEVFTRYHRAMDRSLNRLKRFRRGKHDRGRISL